MQARLRHISFFRYLLLTLPFIPVVYLVLLQSAINRHTNRMEQRLEQETLVTRVIPASQLLWQEYGREIILPDGTLMDVASIRLENNVYIVRGLPDRQEQKLLHTMAQTGDEEEDCSIPATVELYCEQIPEPLQIVSAAREWEQTGSEAITPGLHPILLPPPQACC